MSKARVKRGVQPDLPVKEPDTDCNARKRAGSGYCGKSAGWGTDHLGIGRCKLHGGNVPNQVQHAQKQQAAAAVIQYGLPIEVDPISALMNELYRTAGHVTYLETQVRAIEQGEMYGPVGGGPESVPKQEPHVWIRMYQAERDHLTKVAETCIKIGIDERRVRIAEAQGVTLAGVIAGVLRAFKIDPTSDKARKVVREQLQAASGPDTALLGQGTERTAA